MREGPTLKVLITWSCDLERKCLSPHQLIFSIWSLLRHLADNVYRFLVNYKRKLLEFSFLQ